MADQNDSVDQNEIGKNAIEAVAFDAPDTTQHATQSTNNVNLGRRELLTRDDAPWWHSQFNLMLCVFGLLVVAAGLFIVLSPDPGAEKVSNTLVSAQGETSTAASSVAEPDDTPAPWDESRNKQARVDSQDILSELLKSKKELEAKNVTDWGAQAYQSALDKAAQGDEFYKVKDFQNAIATYQQALSEMQGLDALIPDILNTLIKQGNNAIDQGKTGLAREKFQAAVALDRNNIPALEGINRAATLDQVLGLIRDAVVDEQEFQSSDDIEFLSLASDKYDQALTLDSRTEDAKTGKQRVAERIADKQFRDAMSKGFSALFARRYGSAKQGFADALKIKPNDEAASSAYRQSLASDKRSSLASMLASAKRLERNEEWASALSTYQAVLQRDPNQVSAKLGKIRAQARKQLDVSVKAVLSDTLALSRGTQREAAENVLADAKRIKSKGAVLSQQIASIEASLKQVDSTIKVSFTSDGLTDVNLTKAGSKKIRLGKFAVKNLSLKPGRYTISGVRLGFKDERREIELRVSKEDIQTFSIACKTPVGGSAVVTSGAAASTN